MYIHTRVANSRLTWPLSLAYAVAVCLLSGIMDRQFIPQGVSILLAAVLMEVVSNRHSLIRVYSRLGLCIFLTFSVMAMPLVHKAGASETLVLFILHLYFSLHTYQQRESPSLVFLSSVILGAASMLFVQILYFLPFLWILAATRLQAASPRNYAASILGLILPYWLWTAYLMWSGQLDLLISHFQALEEFSPVAEGILEPHLLSTLAFIAVLDTLALIHLLQYSYNDNIKTLMLHQTLVFTGILSTLFLVLQPQHREYLLGIVIACSTPLLTHFFTFSKNRFTSVLFILTLLIVVALTVFNTWTALPIF